MQISKDHLLLMNKIQDTKRELRTKGIKKSGHNKHGGYKYFELEDFIPHVEEVFEKHGLGSWYTPRNNSLVLVVYDKESGEYHQWRTPLRVIEGKENGFDSGIHMKNNQSAQTYARRTLWLLALDLLEPNIIEQEKKTQKTPAKKPKRKVSADKIIKPIKTQKTKEEKQEITPEMVEDILNRTEEVLIEAGKDFTVENATWNINRLCRGNKQLASACINKLKLVTADQMKEGEK